MLAAGAMMICICKRTDTISNFGQELHPLLPPSVPIVLVLPVRQLQSALRSKAASEQQD